MNVGDDPTTGLTETVEASDELAIVDTSGIDAELSSGQSTTLSTTVRAEAVGDATLTVEVTGDQVRERTETAVVEILEKGGFIDRAQNHLDQLSSRVEQLAPPSGGQEQQLLAKLDAADGQPEFVAVDETAIWLNEQRHRLFAAVDPATNEFLHVRLFPGGTSEPRSSSSGNSGYATT